MRRSRGKPLRRSSIVAVLSVMLMVTVVVPVRAETYTPTAMNGYVSGILWDAANDRVFTTGWGDYAVRIRHLDGTPIGSVALPSRGWGMARSGGTLFVELPDSPPSIAKIDIATRTVSGYLSVSSLVGSNAIAVAGGRVWFDRGSNMTSVDVNDDTKIVEYSWAASDPYPSSPLFAPDPSDPDRFIVWGYSTTGISMYLFDASGGSLSLVDSYDAGGVGVEHLMVAPDGSRFYYTYYQDPGIWRVAEVQTSTFTKVDEYELSGTDDIRAIAVSPTGSHIALADSAGRIGVFAHTAASPIRSIKIGQTCGGSFVGFDGMAFGASGTTLATLQDLEQEQFVFYDNATTATATSSITLDITPSTAVPGDPYTVSGDLSLSSGSVSGRSVKILTELGGTTVVKTMTTAADGTFSFAGTATIDTSCFMARFEGTATITGSSAIDVIAVDRLATTLTIDSVSPLKLAPTETVTISGTVSVEGGEDQTGRDLVLRPYGYETGDGAPIPFTAGPGGAFTVTDQPQTVQGMTYYVDAPATDRWALASVYSPKVTVAKRNSNATLKVSDKDIAYGRSVAVTFSIPADAVQRHVLLYESKAGSKTWTKVFDGDVDVSGQVTITRSPTQSVTYRAVFQGDQRYANATLERDVGVHAIVLSKLLKFSGSSGKYKLYRRTQTVFFAVGVIPDQTGRSVTIDLQRYASGTWRGMATDTFRLRDGSLVVVYIQASRLKTGVRYRMVAGYIHPPMYTDSKSPFRYFKIV